MLCILKSIVAWAVLVYVSTNLVRFVAWGILWLPPDERALFHHLTWRIRVGNAAMTLLSILVTAAYLFALFHFWNVWLAVAALVIMATGLRDLVWEVRTGGGGYTRQSPPKGWLNYAENLVDWGMLPLIWYSLCKVR